MRILTWNINSVRLRLPLLKKLAKAESPDVICLQETKTPDEFFPRDEIAALGYTHIHINGMKSYNGVAILSRRPFSDPQIHARAGRDDCRHISVRFEGFDLHNLYIPAGGDIPDRAQNEKFGHKLDFVDDCAAWFKTASRKDGRMVVLGDFNIAPLEHDVWSHKQLLDVVSHTPIEVEKLGGFYRARDWIDAIRHFVPEDQKCYTWWSYRNRDWKKSNRGRRLDHIWATRPVMADITAHKILTPARDWEQPSDHVPVMVDLK
jgi:exodeoxyribonuclease-3